MNFFKNLHRYLLNQHIFAYALTLTVLHLIYIAANIWVGWNQGVPASLITVLIELSPMLFYLIVVNNYLATLWLKVFIKLGLFNEED